MLPEYGTPRELFIKQHIEIMNLQKQLLNLYNQKQEEKARHLRENVMQEAGEAEQKKITEEIKKLQQLVNEKGKEIEKLQSKPTDLKALKKLNKIENKLSSSRLILSEGDGLSASINLRLSSGVNASTDLSKTIIDLKNSVKILEEELKINAVKREARETSASPVNLLQSQAIHSNMLRAQMPILDSDNLWLQQHIRIMELQRFVLDVFHEQMKQKAENMVNEITTFAQQALTKHKLNKQLEDLKAQLKKAQEQLEQQGATKESLKKTQLDVALTVETLKNSMVATLESLRASSQNVAPDEKAALSSADALGDTKQLHEILVDINNAISSQNNKESVDEVTKKIRDQLNSNEKPDVKLAKVHTHLAKMRRQKASRDLIGENEPNLTLPFNRQKKCKQWSSEEKILIAKMVKSLTNHNLLKEELAKKLNPENPQVDVQRLLIQVFKDVNEKPNASEIRKIILENLSSDTQNPALYKMLKAAHECAKKKDQKEISKQILANAEKLQQLIVDAKDSQDFEQKLKIIIPEGLKTKAETNKEVSLFKSDKSLIRSAHAMVNKLMTSHKSKTTTNLGEKIAKQNFIQAAIIVLKQMKDKEKVEEETRHLGFSTNPKDQIFK